MIRFRSFRLRLTITMITLVAASVAVVGVGSYLLVGASLRERLVAGAVARADFNIGVLTDESALGPEDGAAELAAGDLPTSYVVGGAAGVYVDFGPGEPPYASAAVLLDTPRLVSPELRDLVAAGQLAYEFVALPGRRSVVVAGRRPPNGPDFYFFSSAASLDSTLGRLRTVLVAGGAVLTLVGAAIATLIARRVLRPVGTASRASQRMAAGDLGVRLPVASGDEFGRWARSFNTMAESLQAKIAELEAAEARERRFVADVSHELRTPLTALVNEAGLLRDHIDAMPAAAGRVSEMLVADVARLRRLVEDLLEISRLEASTPPGPLEDVAPAPFLQAVISARLPTASLAVDAPERIRTDRHALERIVGNLLDNATAHAPGSAVEVSATLLGRELVVKVADRGPGVSADDLPLLFDRFFMADAARRGASTGLGLAIAREHARRLGGNLTARLRDGGGLAFEARIPVTPLLPGGDGEATSPSQAMGDS